MCAYSLQNVIIDLWWALNDLKHLSFYIFSFPPDSINYGGHLLLLTNSYQGDGTHVGQLLTDPVGGTLKNYSKLFRLVHHHCHDNVHFNVIWSSIEMSFPLCGGSQGFLHGQSIIEFWRKRAFSSEQTMC